MNKYALPLALCCLATGCNPQDDKLASERHEMFIRQTQEYERGLKRAETNLVNMEQNTRRSEELQARWAKVLDKWEEQAKRMDAILDKLEKDQTTKK